MKANILLALSSALFVTMCEKAHRADDDSNPSESSSESSRLQLSSAEVIRAAVNDHSLPPYIRESAEVFQRMLEGKRGYPARMEKAIRELSSTRNEKTCRIWISMLLACEANIPATMPSRAEFAEVEKRGREKNTEGLENSPIRFIGGTRSCVRVLTEFDMPEANAEVEAFLKRFKRKYGATEMGGHMLDAYQMEIREAKEGVENGGAAWQRGRKSYGKEF
jgi:hypothetical protein